jgi:hypothetical protein
MRAYIHSGSKPRRLVLNKSFTCFMYTYIHTCVPTYTQEASHGALVVDKLLKNGPAEECGQIQVHMHVCIYIYIYIYIYIDRQIDTYRNR